MLLVGLYLENSHKRSLYSTLSSHVCFALKTFKNFEPTLKFFSFVFILDHDSSSSVRLLRNSILPPVSASSLRMCTGGTPVIEAIQYLRTQLFSGMAEGDSTCSAADGASSQQQIGGIKLTNDIIFGQSKSGSSNFVQFKDLDDAESEKNKLYLVCLHCNCRIMAPGYATLVKKEVRS